MRVADGEIASIRARRSSARLVITPWLIDGPMTAMTLRSR